MNPRTRHHAAVRLLERYPENNHRHDSARTGGAKARRRDTPGKVLSDPDHALGMIEAEAGSVFTYGALLIPDLLQTADYARAVLSATTLEPSTEMVEHRVAQRLHRQARLTGPSPLAVTAILDECALRRLVGGPTVMAAQLAALLRAAERPHITVHVLPFTIGARPGMSHGFTLFTSPDPLRDHVHLRTIAGDLLLTHPTHIHRFTTLSALMQATALSPTASHDVLQSIHRSLL